MSEYIVEINENTTVTFDGWNVRCGDVLIQREEIVRCKDCGHYTEDECQSYHWCGSWCEQVEPDGFCALGRREP